MTKILVVDDHKLFRDGLIGLLKSKNYDIVGVAENGLKAVQSAKELQPDVIIMDIAMPELNGIEATRKIISENPDIRIIILSQYFERRFILESLKAGALGYVIKDSSIETLAGAIETVLIRQIYLSSEITDAVIKDYIHIASGSGTSAYTVLSSREREVLQLIAEGVATKEIAAKLNVSVKTIETHRKQIMNKLEIHSVAELTKYAIREGLTELH